MSKQFITGNQAVIEATKTIGANCFCGYPITPSTEILEEWAKLHDLKPDKYKMIQSEDETSAGFNVIGAVLAGAKAFTATAGPGHILMQDPLAMAEAMRLPFVVIVMQRGGPSTGTVIYSQQEVTLACYGGNGEGLRIVYSIASSQEAYDYTIKAFQSSWKYRFPTIVLGDGYLSKMRQSVKITKTNQFARSTKLLGDNNKINNLRNCYNFEAELASKLNKDIEEYNKFSPKIVESQFNHVKGAEILLVAHGMVYQAARLAVDLLKKDGKKVGLFRPITLRPFDYTALSRMSASYKKIIILESSDGHFERLVKAGYYGTTKIETYKKPVEPISVEEIIRLIS
ncbi:MAG: hypothetical protein ACD_58C00122G0005 [uncultured bacterium]|nr:MAG: hypothetical protein ACD_58C00122G0005 [uncultured bacterium]